MRGGYSDNHRRRPEKLIIERSRSHSAAPRKQRGFLRQASWNGGITSCSRLNFKPGQNRTSNSRFVYFLFLFRLFSCLFSFFGASSVENRKLPAVLLIRFESKHCPWNGDIILGLVDHARMKLCTQEKTVGGTVNKFTEKFRTGAE